MAKPMTVTTRSDSRKRSTEQARLGKYRPTGTTSAPGPSLTNRSTSAMSESGSEADAAAHDFMVLTQDMGKQLLARIRADPTPLRMTYSTK
jgi:hypothetical protein